MEEHSPLSYVPMQLKIKQDDSYVFGGTGFLYEKNNFVFLITNRHVVTTRDLDNNPLPSVNISTKPTSVEFFTSLFRKDITTGHMDVKKGKEICKVELYDATNQPIWLKHPTLKIDVVAIPMYEKDPPRNNFSEGQLCINNSIRFDDRMVINISDDVFVVGYPFGRTAGERSPLPIWKRATIASEPLDDYYQDGRKTFLIDTTTRSGMSGSPVIRKSNVLHYPGRHTRVCVTDRENYKFLGIYSARIDGDNEADSYLGLVWKKELIEEIIDGNTKEVLPS